MAFHQHLLSDCPEHPGSCDAIICITTENVVDEDGDVIHPAGRVVWISHMPIDTETVESRVNPDHPYHGPIDLAAVDISHLLPPR